MSIISGTVSIEDGVKAKEEYCPARKVRVDLNFSVPDDEKDALPILDAVARCADAKVRELLGRAPAKDSPTLAVTVTATPPKTPEKPAKVEKPAKAEKPAKVEKTKADLAREAGLPAEGGLDESEAPEPAKKDEDDLGDLLGDSAPAPITDLELGKAAQEKNGKEKAAQGDAWAPAKIRDLIAEYSGGKRINDIPAAKRREFLDKLDKLK